MKKLTKQEQRFYDKWMRTHEEFNVECDALVEKYSRETLRDLAEGKSELLRQLAKRHGVEVVDIPAREGGPIAMPRVQEVQEENK